MDVEEVRGQRHVFRPVDGEDSKEMEKKENMAEYKRWKTSLEVQVE